jgi:CheY-like chemotaxis protein
LNVITGNIELMFTRVQTSEVQNELNVLQEASTTLLSVVDDMLVLFAKNKENIDIKFDNGKKSHVFLSDFKSYILQCFQPLAAAKNVDLTVHVLTEDCSISSHFHRFKQILNNIVGNAIKYTTIGYVNVDISIEMEHVLCITVKDSGVGLASNEINRIFENFYRSTRIMNEKGTGLGLCITKEIIESLGGTISVQSRGVNHGSTFTVKVPVIIYHIRDASDVSEHYTIEVTDGTIAEQEIADHILILEDSVLNSRLLKKMISTAHTGSPVISVAATCAGAREYLRSNNCTVLFADMTLPDGDGITVAHEIRDGLYNHISKSTKIVVITADASLEMYEKCEHLNAKWALKPFKLQTIKDVLN